MIPTPSHFCPDLKIRSGFTPYASEEDISRIDFLTGCRKWTCPVCGPKKRFQLIKRIQFGKPNKFLTLSTKPDFNESPRDCFLRTSPKIRKLIFALRKHDRKIRFARILESTKKGFPHYHFCLNSRFLPQDLISRTWEKLTGAKIVDIRVIKGNTISYVAKYVTKNDHVPYTRQRISFSRNWPREEKEKLNFTLAEWSTIWNDEISHYANTIQHEENLSQISDSILRHSNLTEETEIPAKLKEQFGAEPREHARDLIKRDFVLNYCQA